MQGGTRVCTHLRAAPPPCCTHSAGTALTMGTAAAPHAAHTLHMRVGGGDTNHTHTTAPQSHCGAGGTGGAPCIHPSAGTWPCPLVLGSTGGGTTPPVLQSQGQQGLGPPPNIPSTVLADTPGLGAPGAQVCTAKGCCLPLLPSPPLHMVGSGVCVAGSGVCSVGSGVSFLGSRVCFLGSRICFLGSRVCPDPSAARGPHAQDQQAEEGTAWGQPRGDPCMGAALRGVSEHAVPPLLCPQSAPRWGWSPCACWTPSSAPPATSATAWAPTAGGSTSR